MRQLAGRRIWWASSPPPYGLRLRSPPNAIPYRALIFFQESGSHQLTSQKKTIRILKKDLTNRPCPAIINHACLSRAGIAQLVEQLICNQQVGGSSPSTSSTKPPMGSRPGDQAATKYGGIPEWPKGTDCKSAGTAFGGSNPPSPTNPGRESVRDFGFSG